jgi:hypothetical protein
MVRVKKYFRLLVVYMVPDMFLSRGMIPTQNCGSMLTFQAGMKMTVLLSDFTARRIAW